MQIFTLIKHTTGVGKDVKTEFAYVGASLLEGQQMLTEAIITFAKAEAQQKPKEEAAGEQQKTDSRNAKEPDKAK